MYSVFSEMMLFMFLAVAVFILVAYLLRSMMFPTPKTSLKHTVQTMPEGSSAIRERLPELPVRKKMKRRIRCKSRSDIIFKPKFKNKQCKTEPKLVFMAYILKSFTAVFFRDLYHTFGSKKDDHASTLTRLFDIILPGQGKKFITPPMHCKGLFVLATANNVLVCNPTTKEAITLPQSSNIHVPRNQLRENEGFNGRVGFGFLQSTQAYKVARFFYRSYNFKEKRYSMGFEVFTIGLNTCWRVLAKDPPYPLRTSCQTFTSNCIYFYIWRRLDPYAPNAFLCFHLINERFFLLHPPCSLEHVDITKMTLTNLQGRLYLSSLSMNNTKFSVFTTKIGTNLHGWTPRFSFNLALQPGDVSVTPIAEHRGRLLIHVNDKKNLRRLEFYNPKDGSFEEVNGESEDLKMTKEGFATFVKKPWFYVSSYEEKSYLNLSECRV